MRQLMFAGLSVLLAACTPAAAPPASTGPETVEAPPGPAAETGPDQALPADVASVPPPPPGIDDPGEDTTASPAARLRGRVSYPGEDLPAMRVCAIATEDPGWGFCTMTAVNSPHYEVVLPGGTWWLLAWPQDSGTAGEPGLLSLASECLATGGTECNDHTLLEVTLDSGEVREGLDINDWYYEPETQPPPMEPRGEPPPE